MSVTSVFLLFGQNNRIKDKKCTSQTETGKRPTYLNNIDFKKFKINMITWPKRCISHIVPIQDNMLQQGINDEIGDTSRNIHQRGQ